MSDSSQAPDHDAAFAAFVRRARADPAVLGLVLSGSQARESMPTVHSDYDVYVVVDDDLPDGTQQLDALRTAQLDLAVLPLTRFRTRGLPGDPASWDRYAFVHCQVLFDRDGATITGLVQRKAALDPDEARELTDSSLDAWLNAYYRAMKSHRDGRPELAHLDAAESVPYLVTALFALHGRVRPYNKYLHWELERFPLREAHWKAEQLMPRLRSLLVEGDAQTLRGLFTDLQQAARTAGHSKIVDSWADHLAQIQGSGVRGDLRRPH
ncbi:hypothetical protein [Streptacidiphilus sp. EB103A]|uniref:hypothetical protein n=1 Tax=Streptacidiphilus sp. EB103A TaxID=3156275 RepID=UPI0035161C58